MGLFPGLAILLWAVWITPENVQNSPPSMHPIVTSNIDSQRS
jgi:hypothetical protein